MTEKGDGSVDTVSLPPTYAPSEAYTDSPPPAYRGGRVGDSKVVQIVKLVCVTVVVIALLSGFFVLSSNYLKTRACNCDQRHLNTEEGRAGLLQAGFFQGAPPPAAQALVGEEHTNGLNINSLDAGDDAVLGDEDVQQEQEQVDALVEEVVEAEHQLEEEMKVVVEEEEAALQDILTAQADHMKKIKLPVDLILGNPNLAGREVNCEVERRQVPIAPGVLSQTILVTCKDDDRDPIVNNGRQGPPMSILAPIMKMLNSRPGPQPRLIPMHPQGPLPILQQVSMRPPFPMPIPNKPRMSVRGPISFMMPRPTPGEGPSDRMLPRHLQPVVRLSPRFLGAPQKDFQQMSLAGLQRGALPMPQARPRAPPSPVNLSPFQQRPMTPIFPINVLRNGPPRPATHMELQQSHDQTQSRVDHFGPPRGHTLINGRPQGPQDGPNRPQTRVITLPQAIRVHTLPRGVLPPPSHPSMPRSDNAPPPRFAPEPRRSPVSPQVHPDAEVNPHPPMQAHRVMSAGENEPRKHLLMVN